MQHRQLGPVGNRAGRDHLLGHFEVTVLPVSQTERIGNVTSSPLARRMRRGRCRLHRTVALQTLTRTR